MAISLEKLRDRYVKAAEHLEGYSRKVSEKLATGNTTSVELRKFNLITSWVAYLRDKILDPTSIEGKSPLSVNLPIPEVSSNVEGDEDLCISIRNYKGELIPLLKVYYGEFSGDYTGRSLNSKAQTLKLKIQQILSSTNIKVNVARKHGIILQLQGEHSSTIKVTFPTTSDYNDQHFIASNNIENKDYIDSIRVSKGRTPKHPAFTLTNSQINTYNSILEDIAIELKISY